MIIFIVKFWYIVMKASFIKHNIISFLKWTFYFHLQWLLKRLVFNLVFKLLKIKKEKNVHAFIIHTNLVCIYNLGFIY